MRDSEDFYQRIMDDRVSWAVYRRIKPLFDSVKPRDDGLFTIKSLAEYLEVSEKWVQKWIDQKEIPVIKIDEVLRFKKTDIDLWLDTYRMSARD